MSSRSRRESDSELICKSLDLCYSELKAMPLPLAASKCLSLLVDCELRMSDPGKINLHISNFAQRAKPFQMLK